VYELTAEMKPIKHYYTATDAEVKAAIDKVANQGKAKWISGPSRHLPTQYIAPSKLKSLLYFSP